MFYNFLKKLKNQKVNTLCAYHDIPLDNVFTDKYYKDNNAFILELEEKKIFNAIGYKSIKSLNQYYFLFGKFNNYLYI